VQYVRTGFRAFLEASLPPVIRSRAALQTQCEAVIDAISEHINQRVINIKITVSALTRIVTLEHMRVQIEINRDFDLPDIDPEPEPDAEDKNADHDSFDNSHAWKELWFDKDFRKELVKRYLTQLALDTFTVIIRETIPALQVQQDAVHILIGDGNIGDGDYALFMRGTSSLDCAFERVAELAGSNIVKESIDDVSPAKLADFLRRQLQPDQAQKTDFLCPPDAQLQDLIDCCVESFLAGLRGATPQQIVHKTSQQMMEPVVSLQQACRELLMPDVDAVLRQRAEHPKTPYVLPEDLRTHLRERLAQIALRTPKRLVKDLFAVADELSAELNGRFRGGLAIVRPEDISGAIGLFIQERGMQQPETSRVPPVAQSGAMSDGAEVVPVLNEAAEEVASGKLANTELVISASVPAGESPTALVDYQVPLSEEDLAEAATTPGSHATGEGTLTSDCSTALVQSDAIALPDAQVGDAQQPADQSPQIIIRKQRETIEASVDVLLKSLQDSLFFREARACARESSGRQKAIELIAVRLGEQILGHEDPCIALLTRCAFEFSFLETAYSRSENKNAPAKWLAGVLRNEVYGGKFPQMQMNEVLAHVAGQFLHSDVKTLVSYLQLRYPDWRTDVETAIVACLAAADTAGDEQPARGSAEVVPSAPDSGVAPFAPPASPVRDVPSEEASSGVEEKIIQPAPAEVTPEDPLGPRIDAALAWFQPFAMNIQQKDRSPLHGYMSLLQSFANALIRYRASPQESQVSRSSAEWFMRLFEMMGQKNLFWFEGAKGAVTIPDEEALSRTVRNASAQASAAAFEAWMQERPLNAALTPDLDIIQGTRVACIHALQAPSPESERLTQVIAAQAAAEEEIGTCVLERTHEMGILDRARHTLADLRQSMGQRMYGVQRALHSLTSLGQRFQQAIETHRRCEDALRIAVTDVRADLTQLTEQRDQAWQDVMTLRPQVSAVGLTQLEVLQTLSRAIAELVLDFGSPEETIVSDLESTVRLEPCTVAGIAECLELLRCDGSALREAQDRVVVLEQAVQAIEARVHSAEERRAGAVRERTELQTNKTRTLAAQGLLQWIDGQMACVAEVCEQGRLPVATLMEIGGTPQEEPIESWSDPEQIAVLKEIRRRLRHATNTADSSSVDHLRDAKTLLEYLRDSLPPAQ